MTTPSPDDRDSTTRRGCGPYDCDAFTHTGGYVVDGLIDIKPEVLEGSVLGDVLAKANRDIYFASELGVEFVKPWIIYRSDDV